MLSFGITGDGFSWHTARELEVLTDKAVLDPAGIIFDDQFRSLTIHLRRYELASGERSKRRLFTPYRYNKQRQISATLVVRNVVDYQVEPVDCGLREVNLILGVQLRNDCLLLRSAQELQGRSCFFLEVKFTDLDLILQDDNS